LAADKLMNSPRLYATFLLWMLSELFEQLPEIGDPDKPKLVFFFDEAHLLFKEAPKALIERIELVVRLVRSKGVGVYFVTQNPLDIPDSVLAQLGNRVQHVLRAFTPRDQKAVAATAPEKIGRSYLHLATGLQTFHVRQVAAALGLDSSQQPLLHSLMDGLLRLFLSHDCSQIEINPLITTPDGALVALDGKINFDDNALAAHPEIAALRDSSQEDPK
jgi:DNA helicase HerA-like ATPase